MREKFAILLMFLLTLSTACTSTVDIPLDFPTPPGPAPATRSPKIEFKRDAELEKQIAEIAKDAKGKVGVAAVLLETGEAAFLNADEHFPMQSVYKLPIAMAVMEQVRLGELELDEAIGVTQADFVRPGMASVLRDKSPDGGEFTIRGLIRLALVESDGTASDVLMRVAGGAAEIQSYLTQIGIDDMKIVNTEKEIGRDWQTQYENWATPLGATEMLRWLNANWDRGPILMPSNSANVERKFKLLVDLMGVSIPGAKRLKALLPRGTYVAHKTGTGGTQNGITGATNDIGIIYLPNRQRLAIAVFVSDSPADEKTREAVIAKIAKACWDRWNKN